MNNTTNIQYKYTGTARVFIKERQHDVTGNILCRVQVIGKKLRLENFYGPFVDDYKRFFLWEYTHQKALPELRKVYKKNENHAECEQRSDNRIINNIVMDSTRASKRQLFTGLACIDRENDKIVGRAAVGVRNVEKAEFGHKLRDDYDQSDTLYANEVLCLMVAYAKALADNEYEIVDEVKEPKHFNWLVNTVGCLSTKLAKVIKGIASAIFGENTREVRGKPNLFQVTVLADNKKEIALYKWMGLEKIGEIQPKDPENYSPHLRFIYGVKADAINDIVKNIFDDPNEISITVEKFKEEL